MTTLQRLQALQVELALIAGQMTEEEREAGHQAAAFDLEDSLYELVVNMGGAEEEELPAPQPESAPAPTPDAQDEEDAPEAETSPAALAEIVQDFEQAYEMMSNASTKMLANGWSKDSLGWTSYLEIDELMNDFLIDLQEA